MSNYKLVNSLDHTKWSLFVSGDRNSSIFQTPEMFKVFSEAKNFSPHLIALVDDNEEILATMIAVVVTNFNRLIGSFTKRAIIWGGPVVRENDPEILEALLREYAGHAKKFAIYSEFRNDMQQLKYRAQYEKCGFEFEDHLNIFIDFTKTEEQLWKDLSRSGRYKVKKAKKVGTQVKILETAEQRDECYNILSEVYKHAKLPFPHRSLFEAAANYLLDLGKIKFFGAINDNKLIGTRIILCHQDQLFDWYAGSYRAYYNKLPNDLLPWEVFKWGRENGFKQFDFGGAGKPNEKYGVRDFKMKFSSELVNPGRFVKIHKPVLMNVGKFGLKVYKSVR